MKRILLLITLVGTVATMMAQVQYTLANPCNLGQKHYGTLQAQVQVAF